MNWDIRPVPTHVEYHERYCRWDCKAETVHKTIILGTLTSRRIMVIVGCEQCKRNEARML